MWGRFPLTRVAIRVLEIAGAGLTSALVAYLLGRTEPTPPAPPPAVVHLAPSDEEMIRTVRSDQVALLDQLRNEADARKKIQGASQPTPQDAAQVAPQQGTPQQATSQQATSQQATSQQATSQQATSQQATSQQATPQSVLTTDVAVSASDLAVASAPVAKTDKSAQAPMRRDQKPERVRVVETKPDAKVDTRTEAKVDTKPRPKVEPRVAPRAEELAQARPMPGVVVDAVARNAAQRDVVAAPAAVAAPVAPPPAVSAPAPENETGLTSTLKGITAWILPSRDRVPVPDQGAARPPRPVGEFQQNSM
jgi:hypothetical protein